jgi:sugar lactone lactonase YvrE
MRIPFTHLITITIFCIAQLIQAQIEPETPIITASVKLDYKATLGEGSLFNPNDGMLYWIDIEKGILWWCNEGVDSCNSFSFGKKIGTVVCSTQPGLLVVALEDGIYTFNRFTRSLVLLCSPENGKTGNRFNDGKCSPAGNFWVGSMSMTGVQQAGALYRIKADGLFTKMIDSVGTSNGIVWSTDLKYMYYIDTPTSLIRRYDYDLALDTIVNPQIAVKIPSKLGYPDGMSIDSEDKLWVAHWGGGGIYRWDPQTGHLLSKVEIPAKNVTSCAFAGKNLDVLYITTARIGNSEENLKKYPHSGSLFITQPMVKGTKSFLFKNH